MQKPGSWLVAAASPGWRMFRRLFAGEDRIGASWFPVMKEAELARADDCLRQGIPAGQGNGGSISGFWSIV